jgi:dTMP kinase
LIVSTKTFTPHACQGLIVLEGVNGAGKSTLQEKIKNHFSATHKVVTSFEPGGTPLGQSLRKLLLEKQSMSISPLAEALLFSADRAEHVRSLIRPQLMSGSLVLLDRYYYSTVAFQGYGHELPIEPLLQLSEIAIQGQRPDLVLLIDLPPEEGLRRNADKEEEDKFEDEELEFHERLRMGFLELAERLPEPFAILDGMKSSEEIFAEAKELVQKVVDSTISIP